MEIIDILSSSSVIANLRVSNKKQALQELSKQAELILNIPERVILDTLVERERLGTTGVGNGIAIPHGKLAGIDHLYGLFARLERPIDFESIDERPVDLIFLLLAPESAGAEHLKALARVSRLLRDKEICEKLRQTDHADALYMLLTDPSLDGSLKEMPLNDTLKSKQKSAHLKPDDLNNKGF